MLALTLFAALVTAAEGEAEDAPFDRPLESMTKAQLKAEYAEVEQKRPGLGAPITLMAIGGGSILYGALFLLTSGPSQSFTSQNPVGYLFVAMIMVGAGMLFPGIWMLWSRREERSTLGARLDAINERLDQIDRADEYARERRQEYRDTQPRPPPGGYVPML